MRKCVRAASKWRSVPMFGAPSGAVVYDDVPVLAPEGCAGSRRSLGCPGLEGVLVSSGRGIIRDAFAWSGAEVVEL
eukprot:1731368-Pyramimonas_sp.AAC.1